MANSPVLVDFANASGPVPLPAHWAPHLLSSIERVDGTDTIEVTTLPSALALGAPARVSIAVRYDEASAVLTALGVHSREGVVPFGRFETPWSRFWLESLPDALTAVIRRRRSTVPSIPLAKAR